MDRAGAPRLTPRALLPVVTELHILGLRVEDVSTAALLDHVLLEAGVDADLEGRGGARGFRPGPTSPCPKCRKAEPFEPLLHQGPFCYSVPPPR